MERAICEKCGERQPADWSSGDLCVACGAAVRREARCAWCAEWSPASKFCRSCGCELVRESLYGAARMLKSAGVDRFSIARKLGELDPDQVENLSRIYAGQLAVVIRRCEEVRLCETYLLQKCHSRRLEEELVPLLPMEKEALRSLASGPIGPFNDRPDLLPEIALKSPMRRTRSLASLALLRQGRNERAGIAAARDALHDEDRELAVEAALSLGHWRVRLKREELFYDRYSGGAGVDRRRLAAVAAMVPLGSHLLPWAAAAFTLGRFTDGVLPSPETAAPAEDAEALQSLRDALRDGISSSDPDLRFTCELALGEEVLLAAELEADDEARRSTARTFLSKRNSPAVSRCLSEGPDEIRKEVLDNLWPPLPEVLAGSVLKAVEHGDAEMRRTGIRLLQSALTSKSVSSLVDVALREADLDMLKTLLRAETLPESRMVVRRVIEAGFFQELYPALQDGARHVDFSDEAVMRLADQNDPEALEMLVVIAERQLRQESDRREQSGEDAPRITATGRFLARTAFNSGPAELRCRAYGLLAGCRFWDWMGPRAVQELFGNPGECLEAMTRLLKDPDAGQICLRILPEFKERWAELGPCFGEYRGALRGLIASILDLIKTHFIGDKSELTELLVAMVPLCPGEGLTAILELLHDRDALSRSLRILGCLVDGYPVFGPWLGRNPDVLEKIVGALLELLKLDDWAADEIRPAAAEILARAATDYPGCKRKIASELAPFVADMTFVSYRTRGPLERLAETVGLELARQEGKEVVGDLEQAESHSETDLQKEPALDHLDDEMLFPGEPLPTLSEYCRFLKAMGSAVNPTEAMAALGMSVDQYVQRVTAWGEVLSRRYDIAIRYSQLVAADSAPAAGPGPPGEPKAE